MTDKARQETDKELEKIEKELTKIYERAGKEIGETWKNYLIEVGKEIASLENDLAEAKKTNDKELINKLDKELKSKKREKTLLNNHYKNLTETTANQLLNVNKIAVAYVNDQLPKIYATNYNWSGQTISSLAGGAISFEVVSPEVVRNFVMEEDKNFLPARKVAPKKDIKWNIKKINGEVLQGILQGESIPKIAKRLTNVQEMNKNASIRTARTIITAAENKGRQDAAEKAAKKGVILKKMWLSTPGKRTRDWHAKAGRKYNKSNAIPIDEPFIVNGEKMMYPGDKSLGASGANLYNCRCSRREIVVGFESKLPPEKRGKIKVTFTD